MVICMDSRKNKVKGFDVILLVLASIFIASAFIITAVSVFTQRGSSQQKAEQETVPAAGEDTQAEEATGVYQEADAYRESRSDEKILPERVEITDDEGNLVMIEEYDAGARSIVVGECGEIGSFPEAVYLVTDEGPWQIEQYAYVYNDDGMVSAEYCYDTSASEGDTTAGELTSVTEYTYYSGRLAKESYFIYDAMDKKVLASTDEWTYDGNGFPMRKDMYDSDSLLAYYEEIVCDSNGSPVEARQYTYNGVLTGVREYAYTETGEYLTYREYSGDKESLLVETEYVYDSKDYLREVNVTYYDYAYDEYSESNGAQTSHEKYTFVYPDNVKNKLGTLDD